MTFLRRVYGPMLSSRLYLESAFLFIGLLFGILWSVLVITLYAVGLGTAIIWVGVPILLGTQALLRPIGAIERIQVRMFLRRDVPPPLPLRFSPVSDAQRPDWATMRRWSHDVVHDRHSWRVLGWVILRMVTGPIGFALVIVYVTVSISLLAAPFLAIPSWGQAPGDYAWDQWFLLGPVAFVIVAPILAWSVRGTANLHRHIAGSWLGPCGGEIEEAALARASRAEEQVRIDQELHDSIGHMISMIVVQAGAGAHVFDRDPEFSRRALSTIEERGRAALGELDRIIARIRGDAPETHVPLPDARDLSALVAGARDAGIDVHARLAIDDVPVALGRGVYRVVQEAVTNAAKHAPGARVDVAVVADDDVVALSVENKLRAGAAASDRGNGLASIRDRVTLLGGHATIGETTGGEFAVRAVLPVGPMLPDGALGDCRLSARCRCVVCTMTRTMKA